MQFSILVALSRNGVIGTNGTLPWQSKPDMERFVKLTAGKTVIMGRKTWDSLPKKPLKGRLNVVISSQKLDLPEGCFQFDSFDQAILQLHKSHPTNADTAFIIGGAQIFNEALKKGVPNKMFLTYIESDQVKGDTYFDPFSYSYQWRVQNTWPVPAKDGEKYDITFVNYEKQKPYVRKFKQRELAETDVFKSKREKQFR